MFYQEAVLVSGWTQTLTPYSGLLGGKDQMSLPNEVESDFFFKSLDM